MALKKSFSVVGNGFVSGSGIVVKTGEAAALTPLLYVKVENITGNKHNIKAFVSYTNETTNDQVWQKRFEFVPDLNAGNFIAQAYVHLKTLPEFAGAMDC